MKSSTEFIVPLEAGATTALAYPAVDPAATLILAHGAGAGQRHPFMTRFAGAIAALGIDVVTFNFPYAEQRRRIPDKGPVLEDCFERVLSAVAARRTTAGRIFIGGKSMGGRIATQLAAQHPAIPINGLVLLGYPLHPPGKPDQLRTAHLPFVGRPMLFVQGSRDTFGTPDELRPALSRVQPPPALHVIDGGDHSFKIPGRDRPEQAVVYDEIQRAVAAWIGGFNGVRVGVP